MPTGTTASLFESDEPPAGFSLVEMLAQSKPASKAQQNFQRLIGKIERKRELLKQWQGYELRYQQRVAAEVEPLRQQLRTRQRSMVELIDQLLSPAPAAAARGKPAGQRLARVQQAKLHQLLMQLLAALLEEGDDAALEALHDKYSDVSHAQMRQSEMDLTQALLEDVFGLDVGDDHGASDTEELLRHAHRKMQERAEQAEAEGAGARRQGAGSDPRAKAAAAKAQAAQVRRDQAAQAVSQSLRDVYRKLASALHPDREPDAAARARKTLLMQRVNQAYDANDLLTLLGLQLEIEQIDLAQLSAVPPQRLAHYNQVLREQLEELDGELARCMLPFQQAAGSWSSAFTPAAADHSLNADIARLRATIRQIDNDLVVFRDPRALRDSLAHYPLEDDAAGLDELTDLADLAARSGVDDLRDLGDLLRTFGDGPAPRRKVRRRR
jgi:hypothetical protein